VITKTEFASQLIEQRFLSDYRELLSHYDGEKVFQSLSSFLQLNNTISELQIAATCPGEYRKTLALALITLINRNALQSLTDDLNEAAEKDLDRLRQETGVDLELVPPPPPKPPTVDELLRQEITNDWRTLSSDKIRQKRNCNRQYGLMLDRMANEGALDSAVTSIQRLGQ
jgi:hypothetical protein